MELCWELGDHQTLCTNRPAQFLSEVQSGKISENSCVEGPRLYGAFKIYFTVLCFAPLTVELF